MPEALLQCDVGSSHQMTDSELRMRRCVNLDMDDFKWTATMCVCVWGSYQVEQLFPAQTQWAATAAG